MFTAFKKFMRGKTHKEKRMALNERDIRRIAWEVAEKTEAASDVQGQIAKDVANALWTNLVPGGQPWQKVPQKP
jgi:hypothetical protein